MCRWFLYVSPDEPCLLEDVLVTPAHALSKQIHDHYLPKLLSPTEEKTTAAEITARNRLFNVDGFGMAWYTSTSSSFSATSDASGMRPRPELHPALYKSIQPPLHDANFRSISSNTSSKVVFAHVRAATTGGICYTNNHPFTFGIHTIMHNGYISDFQKIKRQMSNAMSQEAYEHIQGSTDTEHFAALLMSFLCIGAARNPSTSNEDTAIPGAEDYHSAAQIRDALKQTISTIIKIQQEVLGPNSQPNDLNIAVTDGKSLVACRFRNHVTEQPPSLYYSTQAGVTLNRMFPDHPDGANGPHGSAKDHSQGGAHGAEGHNPYAKKSAGEHGKHVIIASEPTTYKAKEWTLVEKNRMVLVGSDGEIVIEEVDYLRK